MVLTILRGIVQNTQAKVLGEIAFAWSFCENIVDVWDYRLVMGVMTLFWGEHKLSFHRKGA